MAPPPMDDPHTQQALDDLADLFLTGTLPGGSGGAGQTRPLDGPAPLRLPPKIVPRRREPAQVMTEPAPAPTPTLRLHRDEPASGPATRTPDPRDHSPPALHVEAVVLGNLPGFGAPWLTQYAHHLAQQYGPVGVIHVDEPMIDVEVVTTPGKPASLDDLPPAGPKPDGSLTELVGQLSSRPVGPITCWLLHLASPTAPTALPLAHHTRRWTILSGADDTAIVAAYRLLKQLIDSSDVNTGRQVGLMVMGSDEPGATAAAAKLGAAAENFLHAGIRLLGQRKQMMPVERHDVGSFTEAQAQWARLSALFEQRAAADAAADSAADADQADNDEAGSLWDDSEASRKAMARAITASTPEEAPAESPPVHEVPPPPPRHVEQLVAAQTPPTTTTDTEPDLAALLTHTSGAVVLDARCPRQPDTRLLLDQNGQLHLLRRDQPSIAAAIVELIDAGNWVIEHLELLRLTQRQLTFDAQADPVLHLFTSDGRAAATMAARLGTTIKLHLLQRTGAINGQVWISTELN